MTRDERTTFRLILYSSLLQSFLLLLHSVYFYIIWMHPR